MANPVPTMANPGDALLNLILAGKAIGGTTGTRTTSSGVSQEGLNRIIQTALQGQGGLAGILSQPAIAGGYNSSARSLLANDLMARISAEAAAKTSKQTVTTKEGGVAAGDLLKAALMKTGTNVAGNVLNKLITGGAAAASGAAAAKTVEAANAGAPWLKNVGGVDFSTYGNYGTSAVSTSGTSANLSNTLDDWLSSGGMGSELAATSFNWGPGITAAIGNAADGEWGGNDLGSTVGATLGSYFGPLGTMAGSWLGGAVGDSALNGTESYLANSGGGLFTGDASIRDVIESGFGLRDIFQTDYNVVRDAGDAIGGLFSQISDWF